MRFKAAQHFLFIGSAACLFACASTPKVAEQQTVFAEGTGTTCQEALAQAKVVASDKAVGSFINSQKSLVADKVFSEDRKSVV